MWLVAHFSPSLFPDRSVQAHLEQIDLAPDAVQTVTLLHSLSASPTDANWLFLEI